MGAKVQSERRQVLEKMTKNELVEWFLGNCFFHRSPSMSEVLFLRWNRLSNAHAETQTRHIQQAPCMKQRDDYQREYEKEKAA